MEYSRNKFEWSALISIKVTNSDTKPYSNMLIQRPNVHRVGKLGSRFTVHVVFISNFVIKFLLRANISVLAFRNYRIFIHLYVYFFKYSFFCLSFKFFHQVLKLIVDYLLFFFNLLLRFLSGKLLMVPLWDFSMSSRLFMNVYTNRLMMLFCLVEIKALLYWN